MAARKKSGRPRPSGDTFKNLHLIFQIIVLGIIGWFIYSGYAGKHFDSKAQKNKSVQVRIQKEKARKLAVKSVSSQPVVKSISQPKEDVSLQSQNEDYPDIPVPPRLRSSKKIHKPKIVFVIDDIGYIDDFQSLVTALGDKITYSILPDLEFSRYFDALSRKTGADVILHLPLEAQNGVFPGPGLIKKNMSDEEVIKMLNHDLESVPHFSGANNHMGSLGSTDRRLMRVILSEFKRRGKFFLDSYTTKDSVVLDVAEDLNMQAQRRDVFLDNTDERPYIRARIKLLADVAYKKGFAIAIGHYRYNTLKVISEEIPRLEASGYAIIHLSDIYDK